VPADAAFQFTYWHNSLFNAAIPGDARVLEFRPCIFKRVRST